MWCLSYWCVIVVFLKDDRRFNITFLKTKHKRRFLDFIISALVFYVIVAAAGYCFWGIVHDWGAGSGAGVGDAQLYMRGWITVRMF